MASMNQQDMEAMLGEICTEGETYSVMLWSMFATNGPSRILLSKASDLPDAKPNMMPLNNVYAYVGLTERHLNFVVVNAYKVSQVIDRFSVPLGAITRVEAKNGLILGKILLIEVGDAKIQLELTQFASGHRDDAQKAARDKLIRRLVELNRR